MAREQYVVLHDGAQWRISFSGSLYGSYASADAAKADAIATAEKAVAAGLSAQVLVEGAGGGFQTAWSGDPAA